MKSQTHLGSILQNVQTSIWCMMNATLVGYLVLIQITNMIRHKKEEKLQYKRTFWTSFGVVMISNIILLILTYLGLKDLQQTYAISSGIDPFNLEYEIVFLTVCYAIIPLIELIIFQDRIIKPNYLLLPILILILISLVSSIFNMLILGFDQSIFVFIRHLAYFVLPAIFSQMNLNLINSSID